MFANALFGEDVAKVRHDPKGSLFARFAERTPPQRLLAENYGQSGSPSTTLSENRPSFALAQATR
jgi:hypothetical protein